MKNLKPITLQLKKLGELHDFFTVNMALRIQPQIANHGYTSLFENIEPYT